MTNMLERIEALLVSLRDQVDSQAEQLQELSARSASMQVELRRLRAEVVATVAFVRRGAEPATSH